MPSSPQTRSRASTLQNGAVPNNIAALKMTDLPLKEHISPHQDDIFEKSSLISGEEGSVKDVEEVDSPNDIPEGFDDLPIELISLIDRFIESLSAKVYNTPPSVDNLSSIFQDFYTKAEAHIATHISALSTRQSRENSPTASTSSKSSQPRLALRSSSRDTLGSPGGGAREQQMLTPQEVSDRRKARRLLHRKGVALEEAVERRLCERVYNRIWRHRSTLDEVRDEKLRSRTAALALVGIGLSDLGIDMGSSQADNGTKVEHWIAKARDGLLRMNDAKYPLGKLQQLAAAHKNIVDLLSTIHQSSSSADEILPTLIYTLITTPPEGINVISNLHFIQRFRASSKVDGEAAYCLTNLEAALTFLETVDLASLRSDEPLEGPSPSKSISSRPATPQSGDGYNSEMKMSTSSTIASTSSTPQAAASEGPITHLEDPLQTGGPGDNSLRYEPSHRRRVSNLLQPPATALGAAGDAVRNTADQGIKSIGSALDNSFKLLFGRLGEQQVASPNADATNTIVVPKTLDDARKLVEPKPVEDDNPLSDLGSATEPSEYGSTNSMISDDTLLSAIAGRKQSPRDQSVDSSLKAKIQPHESAYTGNAAVESMRNLGNSLNPLKGFGGMSVMRGFARTSSSGTPTPTLASHTSLEKPVNGTSRSRSSSKASAVGIRTLPPIQRFVEAPNSQELKMSEIPELLQDYKRLAEALKTLGAY